MSLAAILSLAFVIGMGHALEGLAFQAGEIQPSETGVRNMRHLLSGPWRLAGLDGLPAGGQARQAFDQPAQAPFVLDHGLDLAALAPNL